MNPLNSQPPSTRHWKDIPQQVRHRAMSSGGRRRVLLGVLKTAAIIGTLAALAWGGAGVAAALHEEAGPASQSGPAVPLHDLVLVTDGVLDQAWLARTLAVPKGTSLMALDLFQLRTRLLASGQVRAATLTRNFPATLAVTLTERLPVVRLQVQDAADGPRTLLVARDGTVYAGSGYDPQLTETLPWLAGVKLQRQGGAFLPVAGLEPVADLLAKAKLEAEPLYAAWRSVSLARLESDGEIEVGTKDAIKLIFATNEDFFRQLANLDAILDAARAQPEKVLREVNLAVGGQVPVAFDRPGPPVPPPTAAPASKGPLFTGFNPP